MKILKILRCSIPTATAIAVALCPFPANGQLPVSHAISLVDFAYENHITVSDSGDWLAYAVRGERGADRVPEEPYYGSTGVFVRVAGAEIRAVHLPTARTRTFGGDGSSNWLPAWSPDGARLAFYSDRDGTAGLWVWEPATNRLRRLSGRIVRPSFPAGSGPRWAPDGRTVLVNLLPAGADLAEMNAIANGVGAPDPAAGGITAATVSLFDFHPDAPADGQAGGGPEWWDGLAGGTLAYIDAETGGVSELVTGIRPLWWAPSPDGKRVAFMHLAMAPDDLTPRYELHVLDADGSSRRVLDGDVRQEWGTGVSWSPDGRWLAYFSRVADQGAVLWAGAGSATRAWAPATADPNVPPRWRPDASALLWSASGAVHEASIATGQGRSVAPEGRRTSQILSHRGAVVASHDSTIVVLATDPLTLQRGWYRCDFSHGCTTLNEEDRRFGDRFTIVALPDGGAISAMQSATSPPDLWRLDAEMRPVSRISRLNPELDRIRFGENRLVTWMAPDGSRLRGALIMPPHLVKGKSLPLIVEVYGGSRRAGRLNTFDPSSQLLATRGYAVFLPDAPIRRGEPAREIAEAVNSGLDHLVAEGIADARRIGVMGHSYGGYSTLVMITATDRFSAAIASAGQGNLFTKYGQMRPDGSPGRTTWVERGQGRMRATPWEARDRYIANSPFFRLDSVTTPLLLLHGGADPNTPAYHAEAVFTALQRLGQRVAYARYENEGHSPGTWRLANRVDYWQRVVTWFKEHIPSG